MYSHVVSGGLLDLQEFSPASDEGLLQTPPTQHCTSAVKHVSLCELTPTHFNFSVSSFHFNPAY